MKKIKSLMCWIVILCIFSLNLWCNGEAESEAAPMKSGEKAALYSTIQTFVGKWWNGSDLYPDPCGWTPIEGVSCDLFDGFWYVTELSIGSLHENSLNCAQCADFSPHLFALSHLKSLLFFNCFTALRRRPISIPARSWGALGPSLESLEFRSNPGLTGRIPPSLGELKSLKSMVMVENGLSGELHPFIGNLKELERLNLAGNSFVGQIPHSLVGLKQLLILDLSRNLLSGPLTLSFGGMVPLLKLDLSYNKLQGNIPESLGNLKNLTLLDLSNNRLRGGITKSLENLEFLQELVLSNNPIGGGLMELQWERMTSLAALELSNASLTGGIPESMARLRGLRFLGLNNNMLTGEIPSSLASLPNVGAMYLHGNNLTGELEFSALFYGKMGRRFGAWDNPNLCYRVQANYVPKGVKQCQKDVMRFLKFGDSKPLVSLGSPLLVSSCVRNLVFVMFIVFNFM
ncbi:piriformospora indica-insensitive protein 2-like [Salvia hispanica]|uniref:piriformospora indica-insensitive protein 2-like n=1 Tax=Salvia hispanica TaxID=49212 RepID=UPI00200991F0|nr:piriformospora indica-insensitive protein 2-like [Salvia hispanica]XP_047973833.1 piriformospora indica-insensitive protein 2-like [Salvia hispanica]